MSDIHAISHRPHSNSMALLKRLSSSVDPQAVGARMRMRRAETIKALINQISSETGSCRILDIGGETSYWAMFDADFLRSRQVHVAISNVASWSPPVNVDPEIFSIETGDGCDLPYPDNAFDLVHSNSVIEHVGDWSRMLQFATQVRRLARHYYVQVPHFWFPYEPHFGALFFHWLPESSRVSLLTRRPMGHYPKADNVSIAVEWAQSAHLLDQRQLGSLFPDASIHKEKMLGLTKSLIAIRGLKTVAR